jgi:hypothetical protein
MNRNLDAKARLVQEIEAIPSPVMDIHRGMAGDKS